LSASWADFFKQARANPDVLAGKTLKQVAEHTTEIINALDNKPAVRLGGHCPAVQPSVMTGLKPSGQFVRHSW
jgi:hypothetical protein